MNERLIEILRGERGWLSEARIAVAGGWRSRVHVRLQLRELEREGRVERQALADAPDDALWRYVSPAAAAMDAPTPAPRRKYARMRA